MRKPDSDLQECLRICEIKLKNVVDVLAEVPGEADESCWHAVIKLANGKYGYLTGWCDYTGWSCQDGANFTEAKTAIEAAKLAKSNNEEKKLIKDQLLDQLKGKQPFGLREE